MVCADTPFRTRKLRSHAISVFQIRRTPPASRLRVRTFTQRSQKSVIIIPQHISFDRARQAGWRDTRSRRSADVRAWSVSWMTASDATGFGSTRRRLS